ncbi:DNA topoisomerase IV subunit A [Gluconacetobacter diazotrophicus]|uniref:DNA topoisomerase 4 subunit A n=1 Tax=Gluconacetobacter diazotrophicus (strain ATCC 49037 / DSM 5601 / CCUG 37298 / CIP 103539 / LMG 7603 / PAl5) TaxID=272568 RepID=A9HRQ1_GLUDA|nr:DNA topoisomerase IV subunit A [Gluconacetobacter diazotrophicus]CAP56959.1 putative DNA topoisomerase 4 subunit A [Gluconacetobacter diazotrophicus PA1 5]
MSVDTSGHIEETRLADALSERYLAYAMSTIMSRSLPDVRDGLKPVHRRMIYAMRQLRLDPTSGFKKCARVVGDVIGKYHPHGDASVYEALVRLAQDFAVRYPLVEGQGNFGSIDGDNAAAMRYTEARMTEVARALLEGIDDDSVDFRPTYDGEEQEPVVLSAAFPNLLANGAAGIAVGMATSIPPHNVGEICSAAIRLIRSPDATVADLMEDMPGPDFPTGGLIVEDRTTLLQAYETGRGSMRIRARWSVEQGRFGTWQVVVTEIPYQVQKSRLIEQIADLMEQKKLPLLGDIRDESTTDIRLVLEPKSRGVEPEVLMETLFRATALESRFALNMNVLGADRVPGVRSLREVLRAWLDHRHDVLQRRSRHRLQAVDRRLEILDGFLAVYLNLDEVIRIIREEDDAKAGLMATFSLTELQAESILNMRLRSLRRLEELEIRKEHAALTAERGDLTALLGSEPLRWKKITEEVKAIRKAFGAGALGTRRSELAAPPRAIELSAIEAVEREPLTLILSAKGWVKTLKGHGIDPTAQKFKEGDGFRLAVECQSTDRLCVFATDGRAFTLRAADLPRGRGDGQPIRLLIELSNDEDLVAVFPVREGTRHLLASSAGRGLVIRDEDLVAEKRTGKQVLNLKDAESARICLPVEGDHVVVLGQNRRMLVFPVAQLPEMARGLGVALQKYKEGGLMDACLLSSTDGAAWPDPARIRPFADFRDYLGKRADVGRPAPAWATRKPKPKTPAGG